MYLAISNSLSCEAYKLWPSEADTDWQVSEIHDNLCGVPGCQEFKNDFQNRIVLLDILLVF